MSNQSKGINTFQRYLSVWVLLCMAIGVLIGHFIPAIPEIRSVNFRFPEFRFLSLFSSGS